jgi:hypothetical protein
MWRRIHKRAKTVMLGGDVLRGVKVKALHNGGWAMRAQRPKEIDNRRQGSPERLRRKR